MFAGFSHSFINREYTSSVESFRYDYGGGISLRNAYLPVNLHYLNADWKQNELATGREYYDLRETLRAEANKSFGTLDKNQLGVTYDDYQRKYGPGSLIHNYTTGFRLNNQINFNQQRNSFFNSLITFRNQEGSQPYERLQSNQNTRITLPVGFLFSAYYRFVNFNQLLFKNKQHNISGQFDHKLFLSLNSRIYYEYIDIQHSSYNEYVNRAGLMIKYQKNIPTGWFNLGYEYRKRNDNRNSQPGMRRIVGEVHELNDSMPVLLDNPDVDESSVIVWSSDRTIIYDLNIDYFIVPRGDYIEIQRLPGGQIINGDEVQVDYTSFEISSYRFDTNINIFQARVSLLNRIMEVYARFHEQNYDNVQKASNKILKLISQKVYGIRINWLRMTLGWEFDDFVSNVVPYQSYRYLFTFSENIGPSLNFRVNANWRDHRLVHENERQQFADISGRIAYFLTRMWKLSIDGGYRFQEGRGIDLNLTNMRIELSTRIRDLYFSTGIEIYRRDFSGEIINYNGAYVRLERKF